KPWHVLRTDVATQLFPGLAWHDQHKQSRGPTSFLQGSLQGEDEMAGAAGILAAVLSVLLIPSAHGAQYRSGAVTLRTDDGVVQQLAYFAAQELRAQLLRVTSASQQTRPTLSVCRRCRPRPLCAVGGRKEGVRQLNDQVVIFHTEQIPRIVSREKAVFVRLWAIPFSTYGAGRGRSSHKHERGNDGTRNVTGDCVTDSLTVRWN
ncbi:hypothetical protein Bbelb_434610, partial [Branchiostoma belcheri]